MGTVRAAVWMVLASLAAVPILAADGQSHLEITRQAMTDSGFTQAALTVSAVGNLSTSVFSSLPKSIQPFINGPWGAETSAFEADNLLSGQDVASYLSNLEDAAQGAVTAIASDMKANKCSAAGCDGHAGPGQKHSPWNDNATSLKAERQSLLLYSVGAGLHALQNFYFRSNWVDQWVKAGRTEGIPTWDDASAMDSDQARAIMAATVTGACGLDPLPEGAVPFTDLDTGSTTSGSHQLVAAVAAKATAQWLAKVENWVSDAAQWNQLTRASGLSGAHSRMFAQEQDELTRLLQAAGDWDSSEAADADAVAASVKGWQNRYAPLALRTFRKLLSDVSRLNPANQYAAGQMPARQPLADADQVGGGLRVIVGALDKLGAQKRGASASKLASEASQSAGQALVALDKGDATQAYLDTLQARSRIKASQEAAKSVAADDFVASLDEVEAASGQVLLQVAQIPTDVDIWAPSEIAEGEAWTGLVTVQTPVGDRPYDGDIIINGEPVPVENGRFAGPIQTALGGTVLAYGIRELFGSDRRISPPIATLSAAAAADPTISDNSSFVHPRQPVLTISGQGLAGIASAALVNDAGQAFQLPVSAGSAYQQIYLTPPGIPAGNYSFVGQMPDGTTVLAPMPVSVARFSVTTTPVTQVGQSGQVTVTGTSAAAATVEILGGEPFISIPERIVEVCEGAPGVTGFTATKPGSYTIIARPFAPDWEDIAGVPISGEEMDAWRGRVIDNITQHGGPDVYRGDSGTRNWISDLIDNGVLFDLDNVQVTPKEAKRQQYAQRASEHEKKAEEYEKEADDLERSAAEDERKANAPGTSDKDRAKYQQSAKEKRRQAAEARKKAGDERNKAANDSARAGDHERAAENHEKAAENYRAETEDYEKAGRMGSDRREASSRAASSEQKAAKEHKEQGNEHKNSGQEHESNAKKHDENAKEAEKAGDKDKAEQERKQASEERKQASEDYDKAAGEYSKAGQNYGRASGDYGRVGNSQGSNSMQSAQRGAQNTASGLRERAAGLR